MGMQNALDHRSHRCFICALRFRDRDEIILCEQCGGHFHAACLREREHESCPRCTGESWIGAVEF